MTVCVSIKVHDCIVFAADSASSLAGVAPDGTYVVSNVWNHGVKVFNLHKGLPLCAMTCGLGHFGSASISSLAKDLRLALTRDGSALKLDPESYTIEEVCEKAHGFLKERYEAIDPAPAVPHSFEFWIAGYGSNGCRGEIRKIVFADNADQGVVVVAAPEHTQYLAWSGQPAAINRLILGYDHEVLNALCDAGMAEADIPAMRDQIQARTLTPLIHAAMPIVDAIRLADFLVDVTKRYFSFLPGADIVGGETEIATVTRHEGFKWIKRKHYYPANLNPRETDHVS